MSECKVEYLTVIDSIEAFCTSIPLFNNLLQTHEDIEIISGDKVVYGDSVFGYQIIDGEIESGRKRYFHLVLTCFDLDKREDFKKFLRSLRTIINKVGNKPVEVLRDDLSGELSSLAYPVIYKLENMMRKLLTKFMYISIGVDWTKDAVPREVSESIKSKKNDYGHGYLHEVDFIQLSKFLFKEYTSNNAKKTLEKLKASKSFKDLDLHELKELVPRSNWERYFAEIVECKSDYLERQWEKLYKTRCLVAHNNYITEDQYNELLKISAEVKQKLSGALNSLDKIVVTSEEREDVAENIASSFSLTFDDFLSRWNSVSGILTDIFISLGIPYGGPGQAQVDGIPNLVNFLSGGGYITKDAADKIFKLYAVRNEMVHNPSRFIESNSEDFIKSLESIEDYLQWVRLEIKTRFTQE